jgi:hypothetical protein
MTYSTQFLHLILSIVSATTSVLKLLDPCVIFAVELLQLFDHNEMKGQVAPQFKTNNVLV